MGTSQPNYIVDIKLMPAKARTLQVRDALTRVAEVAAFATRSTGGQTLGIIVAVTQAPPMDRTKTDTGRFDGDVYAVPVGVLTIAEEELKAEASERFVRRFTHVAGAALDQFTSREG